MKFQDSLMYQMLRVPLKAWEKGAYHFMLSLPVILVAYTAGLVIALVVDFIQVVDFD